MASPADTVAISPVTDETEEPSNRFTFNEINEYVPDTEKGRTFEGMPIQISREIRDTNTDTINPVDVTSEHTASSSELEGSSFEDLGSIDEFRGLVSSTPEPKSQSTENNSTSDPLGFEDFFEDFFDLSTGHSSFRDTCPTLLAYCGWLWQFLESPYSIPFWLLLMAAPISAAVMGALHMHTCPGATNLAIMVFGMGICFLAAFLIKIIFVILKMVGKEENCKPLFKAFFGMASIISIALSVTESVYFWKMDYVPEPHSTKYCDPQLTAYAFWWNCFLWVNVVILFFCQA